MTSKPIRMARISSVNTISLESPYEGAQHGTLVVRNDPTSGRDVFFHIQRGQLLCPSYTDCRITVRFDDGEPETWRASGPSDNSSETVFLRNVGDFVRQLRGASVLRLRLEVYRAGTQIFEFHVAGYDDARVNPPTAGRRAARPLEPEQAPCAPGWVRDSQGNCGEPPPCAPGYRRRGDARNCTAI